MRVEHARVAGLRIDPLDATAGIVVGAARSPSSGRGGYLPPPLLQRYSAPSGPSASPFGPPPALPTVERAPSAPIRVQHRPAISVRMTAPSGIATGPSGNPKLLARISYFGHIGFLPLGRLCRDSGAGARRVKPSRRGGADRHSPRLASNSHFERMSRCGPIVMAGLGPAIHDFPARDAAKPWMARLRGP